MEKNYPDKEEPVVILCGFYDDVSTVYADMMSGDPEMKESGDADMKEKMMIGDPENQRFDL